MVRFRVWVIVKYRVRVRMVFRVRVLSPLLIQWRGAGGNRSQYIYFHNIYIAHISEY